MEDITQFIFGMVTMIGVAAIVTLVVGIVKVFKTSKQINNLWSSIDSQNTSIWQSREDICRTFDEDFRSITARFDDVHRTINANFDEHVRRMDNIESNLSSEIEKASREAIELVDNLRKDLEEEINVLRDDLEEKARNSQSYIDSRFDKFEAKITAEKAAKKVLKG